MYIWEHPEWPAFYWDGNRLMGSLATARLKEGRLLGRMERLGFDLRRQVQLESLTQDVVKSSEIEGERLDRNSVRSSIARRLGIPEAAVATPDRRTEGVVEMVLDAIQNYATPLTRERLFGWQAALFPTGYSGLHRIRTGAWRNDSHGPMQVISGPLGREQVHYEAPPAPQLDTEMDRFLAWFNAGNAIDGLLRAGMAHLWFVTIHPFEDGNGRVARAIADQALAQTEASSQRFYSMSAAIQKERTAYYDMLERTQKADVDITDWLIWFLECLSHAIDGTEAEIKDVLQKADFWQRHAGETLNDRQKAILNRFLDGFDGKLTTKKWATLTKVSVPTAQRDINDLIARGVLHRNPGGSKNASYDFGLTCPRTLRVEHQSAAFEARDADADAATAFLGLQRVVAMLDRAIGRDHRHRTDTAFAAPAIKFGRVAGHHHGLENAGFRRDVEFETGTLQSYMERAVLGQHHRRRRKALLVDLQLRETSRARSRGNRLVQRDVPQT